MSHKKLFQLALLLALFITTVWYSAGYIYSYQAPLSEPDSLVYLQYARNMAEGHPFEYVQGDAPTTGCTSYLYPALLAGLYKLGCSGQRLLTACFFLNGAFYLSFVLLVGLIARKLAPRLYPFALFAAVLSGQTLYTFFGQTDMGLLMTLVFFCFWAFLYEKKVWLLIGMLLTGLTHPTAAALAGGLIAAGILCAACSPGTLREKLSFKNSWPVWIGCAGAGAIASTLLFNYLLTGDFIFMSLRSKGLFTLLSPLGALNKTLIHFVWILKGVFFGFDDGNYRAIFFFPLLTGLAAIGGLLLRPWANLRKVRFDVFVLLVVAAELTLLSTNDQQAISHDRYMAWALPLLYIYIAVLLEHLWKHPALKQAAAALASALILFQLISLMFFTGTFVLACDLNAGTSRFARDVLDYTKPGDKITFEGGAEQMWYLKDRGILNPFGLFTAECAKGRHWLCYVETLKYHPDLLARYWIVSGKKLRGDPACKFFLGDLILSDTDSLHQGRGYALHTADWSALALNPPTVSADWTLREQLDIGYWQDEERCAYRTHTRLRSVKIAPCIGQDKNTGRVDIGQVVIGHETFELSNLTTSKPLHVVLRTARQARSFLSHYQTLDYSEHTFSSPLKLTITVDDQPVEVSLEVREEGFSDISFTIPAEMIQNDAPKIAVRGDHLAYGYWFYQ